MRKIVLGLMLVFALVLGGCSSGLESLDLMKEDDTHNSVDQSQLTDLQNQINDLKAQIAAIKPGASDETINAINVTISNLQTDLDTLKSQVGTDNAAIAARLDVLENDVKDLKDRVTVLEATLNNVPQANAPLFVSANVGETETETSKSRGATIRWTASAGGVTASSYNVWAVSVDKDGFFGVPFRIANVVGSFYYWNGHLEGLPVFVVTGPNPAPLSSVRPLCYEQEEYLKYRFAVTAVDAKGNESAPSVTADEFKVKATWEEENPTS